MEGNFFGCIVWGGIYSTGSLQNSRSNMILKSAILICICIRVIFVQIGTILIFISLTLSWHQYHNIIKTHTHQ